MSKPRILIVEDEPIIAADLKDRLEEKGYDPFAVVDSGEAALEIVRKEIPDLILMDVNLTGTLDGVDTALEIGKLANVPLIFLTSNSDDATYNRARQARPRAFLSKPFRGRDLAHAIDLAIGAGLPAAPTNTPPAAAPSVPAATDQEMPAGESAMLYQDRLFVKVKERLSRLMLTDILYVEADDYYCKVYTEQRGYLVTKTLKKLSALLPPERFVRCHRSYVVNLDRITEIGEIYVFFGKVKVPVSRSKRGEIMKRLG